jgi:hypothetical protein
LGCASPLDKSRSGTPEGVRAPLSARRVVRRGGWLIAPFGVLLPFCCRKRVEKSFVACRVLILTVPVLHCRDRLTKVGIAVSFWDWRARKTRGANKKRSARTGLLFLPSRPRAQRVVGRGRGWGALWHVRRLGHFARVHRSLCSRRIERTRKKEPPTPNPSPPFAGANGGRGKGARTLLQRRRATRDAARK